MRLQKRERPRVKINEVNNLNPHQHSWLHDLRGNTAPLFFILGPCVLENLDHTLRLAEYLTQLTEQLGVRYIFKGSFDKANRTSLENYRGLGMDQGLEILRVVREQFGVPVVTDIHESWQAEVAASVVDVLQIPAFLCRQTDLLQAAGKTGRVVHVKKAQFMRPEKIEGALHKVKATGNQAVWLCERGFTLGYVDLVVDYRSFPIMKSFGHPVIFDVTHAVQKPGELGKATGGDRSFVPGLAAAAVAQGIAGVFMEVHNEPEKALSDGPNSVRLSQLPELLKYLIDLDAWVKSRPLPEMF